MSESRLLREAEFHDKAFTEKTRAAAGKFYAVAASAKQRYRDLVRTDCAGRDVLEYGCGTGSCAFDLARDGADVVGIDISPAGIDLAERRAEEEALSERLSFRCMNAESLEFPDRHFDLICGSGILHHLELERALAQLRRVLKKNGRAVFFEPLGHNPLVNLFRRLTPGMRSADEHPLLIDDLRLLAAGFENAEFHFFTLCSLLAIPFRSLPGFGPLLNILETIDRALFAIPFFRKQAWIVVIQLTAPRETVK